MTKSKKKVCVAVFSRANYGSIKKVLEELKKSKKIELQILVGASANIEKFGLISETIKKDKFKISDEIFSCRGPYSYHNGKNNSSGNDRNSYCFKTIKA